MYSRLLTNDEMRAITTCELYMPGDYISWQTTKFKTNPHGKDKTTSITRKIMQTHQKLGDAVHTQHSSPRGPKEPAGQQTLLCNSEGKTGCAANKREYGSIQKVLGQNI